MILTIYTANLASFLIVKNTPSQVINSLDDAVQYNKRVCTLVGSSSSTYFHRQFPNHGVVATPTIEDDFLYLDQGKCDIALVSLDTWELYKGYAEYNGECNKEWIGRTVQYAESGF